VAWACLAALASAALVPVTAAAAAPSPSPSLASVLATPPAADYAQESQGSSLEGDFDVGGYVDFLTTSDAASTRSTLVSDGFVHGFGRTWVEQASDHLLLEVAIAFKGSAGARKWLSSARSSDESDQYYKGPISVSGVEAYYGVHFADPTAPAYADVVSFVKGNDYFIVGFVSAADDLGDTAARQTRKQYDAAPAYTIPPADWPESPQSGSARFLTTLPPLAYGGAGALLIVLLAAIAGTVILVRRRRLQQPVPVGSLMMSNDGRWWWDGAAWRDTASDVPPGVLRSEDGHYWWDGARWQPVPQQAVS
jgi:hypothetical protein